MVYSGVGILGTEAVVAQRRLALLLSKKMKREYSLMCGFCKGFDVTSDSETQHPSPTWPQGKGGIHPTESEFVVWISDRTACAMTGLRLPYYMDPEARGLSRGESIGQQEMEEDGDEWEQNGDVGVYQG